MEAWRKVEVAACEEMEGPSKDDLEAIRNGTFTVAAVQERERVTDHDVAAFVDVVAESVGEHGRWIHYGLTSSDVLDTALALQLRQAGEVLLDSARAYRDALIERALEHRDTLCVGRTHGVHAEPTTFGLRLAGFAFEADRNLGRLENAFEQLAFQQQSRLRAVVGDREPGDLGAAGELGHGDVGVGAGADAQVAGAGRPDGEDAERAEPAAGTDMELGNLHDGPPIDLMHFCAN